MRFIKEHPYLTAAVVAVILAVILAVTSLSGNTTAAETVIGEIAAPVESGAASVSTGIGEWFLGLIGQSTLQKENAELREYIAQLEGQLALNGDLTKENERLKEIVAFCEDNPNYDLITARVTAKSSSYWFDTFVISAGRNQGVKANMAVIAPQGLVGRVVEVGGNWSKVMSMVDSESSVSALIERTRDTGVVRGTSEVESSTARCSIFYLPLDNDLVPGDKVLTSGLDGIFPKGIVIGEVIEVSRDVSSTDRIAIIETAVDFSKLEEVMVLMNSDDEVTP